MARRGLEQVRLIGECRATLFRLADCFTVVAGLLQAGLGGSPPCSRCPVRPGQVPATVDSDWDAESGSLKADSAAWTY